MQTDAYPQVEIANLRTTTASASAFDAVCRYAEGYYRVKGYYPPRITVTKKQHKALSSQAQSSNPRLVYRGVPLEVSRGR